VCPSNCDPVNVFRRENERGESRFVVYVGKAQTPHVVARDEALNIVMEALESAEFVNVHTTHTSQVPPTEDMRGVLDGSSHCFVAPPLGVCLIVDGCGHLEPFMCTVCVPCTVEEPRIVTKWGLMHLDDVLVVYETWKVLAGGLPLSIQIVYCTRESVLSWLNVFEETWDVLDSLLLFQSGVAPDVVRAAWHPSRFVEWCLPIDEQVDLRADVPEVFESLKSRRRT
jgi:hypothetical protein